MLDDSLELKTDLIRHTFRAVMGQRLARYETAELFLDGQWEAWDDLPIRLFTDQRRVISIAWAQNDDLWLSDELSIPFAPEDSIVRWVENARAEISPALDATIGSVWLGRGEMSAEGRYIEIWNRLLIQCGNGWLEVFNAVDENGYDFHAGRPSGEFIKCL